MCWTLYRLPLSPYDIPTQGKSLSFFGLIPSLWNRYFAFGRAPGNAVMWPILETRMFRVAVEIDVTGYGLKVRLKIQQQDRRAALAMNGHLPLLFDNGFALPVVPVNNRS